jgi:hypothetical protein
LRFDILNEDMPFVKFKYDHNENKDKRPKVAILDLHYRGKNYETDTEDDILAYNLDYAKDLKTALKHLNDLSTFSKMKEEGKLEEYKRIKKYFKENSISIRRYKKDFIENLKVKDGLLWKKTTFDNLDKLVDLLF